MVKTIVVNRQSVDTGVIQQEREKELERKNTRTYELADKNACEDTSAQVIPSTVISYKLKKSQCIEVKNAMLSTFGAEMFYGIFQVEEGLCIILKQEIDTHTLNRDLDENTSKILDFYSDIAKKSPKDKRVKKK